MSSFTSLNVSDDDLDIEEHTRELQIEIALNLFNKALKYQNDKDYKNAFLKYNELSRIEIINLNNLEISDNSIINRLKFLCCRNRGMLRLRDLIDQFNKRSLSIEEEEGHKKSFLDVSDEVMLLSDGNDDGDDDDDEIEISVYGEIIGSINDLLNSILFGEPDEKIVFILSSLFKHFNYPRLARLCYELKINNPNSNDDLKINLDHPECLLLNQASLLDDYLKLLKSLNNDNSQTYKLIKSTIENNRSVILTKPHKFKYYNWENILTLQAWKNERKNENHELILNIKVHDGLVDINTLLESIVNCLPKPKGRSKVYDAYMLTDSITDNIVFDFEVSRTKDLQHDGNNDSKAQINRKFDENNYTVIKEDSQISESDMDKDLEMDSIRNQNPDTNKYPDITLNIVPQNDLNKDSIENTKECATTNADAGPTKQQNNDTIPNQQQDNITNTQKVINTNRQRNINPVSPKDTNPRLPTNTEDNQSPLVRTTRTLRTKTEPEVSDQTSKMILQNFDTFISDTLPTFLKFSNIELNLKPLSNLILGKCSNEENIGIASNTKLFYSSLMHWNDEYTKSISVSDTNNGNITKKKNAQDNESIKDILNIKTSKVTLNHLFEEIDMSNLNEFLRSISSKNLHFNEIRMEIVEYFFNLHENQYSVMIVNSIDKKSLKNLKIIVDSVSINFYNQFSKLIYYESHFEESENFLRKLNISVSIYEILIDAYIEFNDKQKLKKITSKSAQHDFNNIESTLLKRINKWNLLLEDVFSLIDSSKSKVLIQLWCRFEWFQLHYLQESAVDMNTRKLIQLLMKLSEILKAQRLYIPYVNYDQILALNFDNIQTLFSRLKILEIFSTNEKSNEILESVLLSFKIENLDPKNIEISQQFSNFLANANIEMKLRLWSLLLRYYKINNNITKYKLAFEKIINMMIDEINPENNKLNSEYQVKIKILNILGFFTYFSLKFINFFDSSDFKCFDNNDLETSVAMVSSISSIVYMLYSFLMYQKAVQVDGRLSMTVKSLKSFEILNNCISCSFFMLAAYYPTSMINPKPEIINDFLSVCHVELGKRNMCASINGIFLKFLQYKLSNIDFKISANDIFQIIHCRFGLSLSFDGFETFDHKCRPKKITLDDSIQLSKYVSIYCFKGKHPVISPPRNDIKNIIDKIVDVVNIKDMKDTNFIWNEKVYKDYLNNTKIDLKLIIHVFNGTFHLSFKKPEFTGIEIAENGLYYLEGLIGLHFFKIRKKTIQSRVSELDAVLRMFENDILFGCNRFETWVALGQTYSYLVEDDLLWTADKLNSFERKQSTSFTQKKALLCYLMAISIFFSANDEEKLRYEPVLLSLWESFARELYCSWMEPLNKKAFHTFIKETVDNVSSVNHKTIIEFKYQPNNIPTNAILKLLELSFSAAIKHDSSNWYNLMYLAKSQCKLQYQNINHNKIIGNLLVSCNLALLQSSKEDPIIEPHYYLFSLIRKFYENSEISINQAIEYLKRDQLFEDVFKAENKNKSHSENANEYKINHDNDIQTKQITFDNLTFHILRKIISYDRKKWQHRPIYKLARAYYDIDHDVNKAKEEMLGLINLKPNVRSLSTIWKPSSERPGKHFIYNSIYTQFIVQLLYENGDIYSLTILLKKMRRAGSIMVNLTKTFDNMMLRICTLIKKSLGLDPNFLDEALSKIRFADFTKYSAEFITHIKETKEFDDYTLLHFFFLSETQAFRKLATGFGATGIIDECYHSIYVKLFLPFLLKQLIRDRGNSMKSSALLVQAKKFLIDKLPKLKQTTPEILPTNEEICEETKHNQWGESDILSSMVDDNDVEANQVDVHDLSWKDQCSIIGFLTFGHHSFTGSPSKEKTKTARRDVSPFAVKIVHLTFNLIESLKKSTNDGETINYHIDGPLDNTEFERTIAGVNAKETKENKEDKEFERLISAHDRSFDDDELKDFNKILSKFDIVPLTSYSTKSEIAKLEKLKLEKKKHLETQRELERLRMAIEGNTPSTEPSTPKTHITSSENLDSAIDKENDKTKDAMSVLKTTAISPPTSHEPLKKIELDLKNVDTFLTAKKLKIEPFADLKYIRDDKLIKNNKGFMDVNVDMTDNNSRKTAYKFHEQSDNKNKILHEPSSNATVEYIYEPSNDSLKCQSEIASVTAENYTADLIKTNSGDIRFDFESSSLKTSTHKKDENVNATQESMDALNKTTKIDKGITEFKKLEKHTPFRQSEITSVFNKLPIETEVSPIKSEIANHDKRKMCSESTSNDFLKFTTPKKIKIDVTSDFNIFKKSQYPSNEKKTIKSNDLLSNERERRNSRRSISNKSTFFELSKTGHVKEQIDIKQRREKLLIENAEVLSSSDSDDDIIVID